MQKQSIVFIFLAVAFELALLTECFNLDTNEPIYKQASSDDSQAENENIFFGYSIAQHIVVSTNTSFIIVGAPKDTYKLYNQSGAIYKCPMTLNNIDDCETINVTFDTNNSDGGIYFFFCLFVI